MTKQDLLNRYRNIEEKIYPIKNFLEERKDQKPYYNLYKGIATLQSPIIEKPKILFLGLNPGDGAYQRENWKQNTNKTPLRILGNDECCFNELNWYHKDNAREKANWYDFNASVKNSFPAKMISLIDKVAKKQNGEISSKNKNDEIPFWYETLGKEIMFTNLYPISTTNSSDLKKIHEALIHKNQMRTFFQRTNSKRVNEWQVRLFFIGLTDELIDLVKPNIIICLGKQAYHDFTYTSGSKGKIVQRQKTIKGNKYDIVGFSRSGNWSGLIDELASKVIAKLPE